MVGRPAARRTSSPRIVDRVGIAIGAGHVRAVALRRGRIAWVLESPVLEDKPLAEVLDRFLRELPMHPLQRWPRPPVHVVLGMRHAQVKRLGGLPNGLDARQLARVVQEGAPRFFLRNGHPLVTTDVAVAADGETWSAALDADVVDAVCTACRSAGLRLAGIAPAAAALPLSLEGTPAPGTPSDGGEVEEIDWEDEEERTVLRVAGGRLAHVARVNGGATLRGATDVRSRPRPLLAPLAERASRFADACGAALLPTDATLVHRPRRASRRRSEETSSIPRWRLAVALAALLLAASAAFLARPLAAVRAERAAAARLAQLGPARVQATRMRGDLAQVSAALTEVERFADRRRSPTFLLAGLARALPKGSALVTVRMDTTGVLLTLLAPRAAPVLGAIERLPGVASPQIVGPVTREVVVAGGAVGSSADAGESVERTTLERMTVRFRLVATEPAAVQTSEAAP